MLRFAVCQALVTLTLATPVLADSPEHRGNAYAKAHCARCHAIDRAGPSPLKIAPLVPDPAPALPIETLGEALAEGINTGHAAMPEFVLDPDQIHDLLSYLKTLE